MIVGMGTDSSMDVGRLVAGSDNNFLEVSTLFLIPFTPIADIGVRRPFDVSFGLTGGSEFRITVVFGNDWVFDVVGTTDFGRGLVC
jgi:hypothetical protein